MRKPVTLSVRCDACIGTLPIHFQFEASAPWTVLFGPSGSGKSSLLRLIAGLWNPPGAVIHLGDDDLTHTPAHRRRVGFVAQQPALFPHLDVEANVRFGCVDKRWADAMIELFDLTEFRGTRPAHISGGQGQRVALARALAASPRLLLLDEVFTGMHLAQRDHLLARLREHCSSGGIPVLSVTHDAVEASLVADDVLKLDAGRVVMQGPAAEVLREERATLRQVLARSDAR